MYQALGSVLGIHFLINFLKCPGEVGFITVILQMKKVTLLERFKLLV